MSSPAGASGTGTGPNANVYTPTMQPQADQSIWQVLNPLITASSGGGIGTPAGSAYPTANQAVSTYLLDPAAQAMAMSGANQGAMIGSAGANTLNTSANQILNTAFDPQAALFNQTQGQVLDQSNVANAMSGVGNTPYGASVTSNALGNFDINWQNQQLARQAQGLGAAAPLYGQAANLAASSGGLPFSTGATMVSDILSGLGGAVNLGNNQYMLPQQVIGDLENYLSGGQSASLISGQLGQMGQNELMQSMSGIGNLAGLGMLGLGGS